MNVRICIPYDKNNLLFDEDECDFGDDLTIYPNWDIQSVPQLGHEILIHQDVFEGIRDARVIVESIVWHYDNTGIYCFIYTRWPGARFAALATSMGDPPTSVLASSLGSPPTRNDTTDED